MSKQAKRIKRHIERIDQDRSPLVDLAIDWIDRVLQELVQTSDQVTTFDCPDSDPNCDEPGDPMGGGG